MNIASKLERLAVDLHSIADGAGPSEEELAQAPLLLNWSRVPVLGTALEGLVLDHPRLGTTRITTSLVYAMDPDGRWARTLSRYYLLQPRN